MLAFAPDYFSDNKWVVSAGFLIGTSIFIGSVIWGLVGVFRERRRVQNSLSAPLIGMIVFGVGFVACAVWFVLQSSSPAPQSVAKEMAEVERDAERRHQKDPTDNAFDKDFMRRDEAEPKASQAAPSKPKPYYSSAEIEAMLGVLRRWTFTIDKKIEPGHAILREELYQWEQKLKLDNLQQKIDTFAKARDIITDGYANLRKDLQEERYFSEQLAPVIAQKPDVLSGMDSALRNAIADLQDLKHPGIDVVKFARPSLQRLQALDGGLGPWIENTRLAIQRKTAELREWRNP